MRLKVNGEMMDNLDVATVRDLLALLKIETGRVAVEVNLAVISKSDYEGLRLNDGDAVEIVNFVGGG